VLRSSVTGYEVCATTAVEDVGLEIAR